MRGIRAEDNAVVHYSKANAFLKSSSWRVALGEFRRASGWWRQAGTEQNLQSSSWAMWGMLGSVLLVYMFLFLVFPRVPEPLKLSFSIGQEEGKHWWERFISNDRPQQETEAPYSDMRQWWDGLKKRASKFGIFSESDGEIVPQFTRRTLDKRWEILLKRYGVWGPLQTNSGSIDHHVIAGSGLSRSAGDYHGAVRILNRGLDQADDLAKRAELHQALANVHYEKGYQLQADGLSIYAPFYMQKAANSYKEVVLHFNNYFALGNLGWVSYILGNYTEADFYSRQALVLNPNLLYVHLNLGLIYIAQERENEAYARYLWTIKQLPSREILQGGIKDLKEMLRDNPSRWPLSRVMLGLLAIAQGDFPLARQSLEAARIDAKLEDKWQKITQYLLQNMELQNMGSEGLSL